MFQAASTDTLSEVNVQFSNNHAMTVVLAAENYPGSVEKGRLIENLPENSEKGWVNHAGTKLENEILVSNGGRVLSCTGIGSNLQEAANMAYSLIEQIELSGSHYRRDIGHRALNKN